MLRQYTWVADLWDQKQVCHCLPIEHCPRDTTGVMREQESSIICHICCNELPLAFPEECRREQRSCGRNSYYCAPFHTAQTWGLRWVWVSHADPIVTATPLPSILSSPLSGSDRLSPCPSLRSIWTLAILLSLFTGYFSTWTTLSRSAPSD